MSAIPAVEPRFRAHDAHVHITPSAVDPAADQQEYLRTRTAHDIGIAAIVTPGTMGWDNETSFAVAATDPTRFRVIARADLLSDDAGKRTADLLARGASGLRLTLLGEPDISWLADGSIDDATAVLAAAGAVAEMHATPEQLADVGRFAARWPSIKVVVDHLGRPDPEHGVDAAEFMGFLALAEHPNVTAKTPNSSFFSLTGSPFSDLIPFYEAALDAFGAERLLWASDWPLCVRTAPFEASFEPLTAILGTRSNQDADRILRTNFVRTFTGVVGHD
ncbi:MAG: amidohydrolase family protein [Microbacterium sp.]